MDKTIEYILEVARCGGIAKASRNLFISPSALSKFIIQKENELGVKLFNRVGNKFTLTYPGERYVEMLKERRDADRRIELEMSRLADMYSGRLRVGFQLSLAGLVTRKIVPAMQDNYPNIRMSLEEESMGELIKLIRTNQLDLILSVTEDTREKELEYIDIERIPIVIVAAKDSPLRARAIAKEGFSHPWIPDEAIMDEKIVMDKGERSFRRFAPSLVKNIDNLKRSEITVANARTALMCVAQDLGIIAVPEVIVKALEFTGEVDIYSFGEEERYCYLSVVYDPRSALTYEITEFSRLVSDEIKKHQPKS